MSLEPRGALAESTEVNKIVITLRPPSDAHPRGYIGAQTPSVQAASGGGASERLQAAVSSPVDDTACAAPRSYATLPYAPERAKASRQAVGQ